MVVLGHNWFYLGKMVITIESFFSSKDDFASRRHLRQNSHQISTRLPKKKSTDTEVVILAANRYSFIFILQASWSI